MARQEIAEASDGHEEPASIEDVPRQEQAAEAPGVEVGLETMAASACSGSVISD